MRYLSLLLSAIGFATSIAALSAFGTPYTLNTLSPSQNVTALAAGVANTTTTPVSWPERPFTRAVDARTSLEVRSLYQWRLTPSSSQRVLDTMVQIVDGELGTSVLVGAFEQWSQVRDGVAMGIDCEEGEAVEVGLAYELFCEVLGMMKVWGVVSLGGRIWVGGKEVGYLDVYVDVI